MNLSPKLEKDLAKAYRELSSYIESMGAKIGNATNVEFDLTVNAINEMVNGMSGIMADNNTDVLTALSDLKKENAKYLNEAKKRVPKAMSKFTGFDQNSLNAMIQMQYLGIETVQAQAVDAIKSATITYINTPTTVDRLLKDLRGRVNQLEAHTVTQLNTFYREYSQTLENQIAKDIGFGEDKDDIWEYAGAPLQDNSRDECIWALNQKQGAPYFTNEEKELFEAGGLYEHSEPRWNCQHDFVMTNITYAEAFGEEVFDKNDEANIQAYTKESSEWYDINKKLRSGVIKENEDVLNLEKSLSKMPNYEGTVFRGMGLQDKEYSQFMQQITGKNLYIDKGFMSTTKDQTLLSDYFSPVDNQIKFKIYSKKGKDISALSTFTKLDEKEVLFSRKSKFQIIGSKTTPLSNGKNKTLIILGEI